MLSCEQIKTEYENLKTLKSEFDLEYRKAVETGDLERVRELRIEMETKRDALSEKLFVSPERAKEIMGEKDFLGKEAVEKAFNIKLSKGQIPKIPFKKEELERAKELGQFLVLRTDKANDGEPLTIEKMESMFTTTPDDKPYFYEQDWYKEEDFFKKETPKLEWALTSKEIIPNSTSKNYLEQTELMADYLKNQVFKNNQIPKEYKEAIKEFNTQKQNIEKLIGDNWEETSKQLSNLKINKITRQTPLEALYDILIYFQNNSQRLLENRHTWTNTRFSNGFLISVGSFGSVGAGVDRGWGPDGGYGDLGVSSSRSF